jgi:hypothetical protein
MSDVADGYLEQVYGSIKRYLRDENRKLAPLLFRARHDLVTDGAPTNRRYSGVASPQVIPT